MAHPIEAGPAQERCQLANIDAAPAVAFLRQRQDGVGPNPDLPADASREVDAEKRKCWVGYGIDEASYQRGALRGESRVLTAKRNDARVAGGAGHGREAVGLQAGAADDDPGGEGRSKRRDPPAGG